MRFCLGCLLVILVTLAAGCAPQPVFTPTPTKTPGPVLASPLVAATTAQPTLALTDVPSSTPDDLTPLITLSVPATSTITETPTVTNPPPTPDDGLPPDHYVMNRPIPAGWRDYGDRTYAYGSTAGGQYRPHTGMEFFNPESTPIVAVANATVEYAGTDWETIFGPQPSFYGNLIILRLSDYTYAGQPVFALYGHLSTMSVQTGDVVPVGEVIGAVGGTGVANGGPHLHFEVRVGNPSDYFTSTRNPDLWIKPYYGYGTLAGRVINAQGAMLREVAITVRGIDIPRYTWTYAGTENISDPEWGENFTLGDLPEGWYTVTTRSDQRTYSTEVYVRAGRTAWIEFVFD